MTTEGKARALRVLTAGIVSSYVARHQVAAADLPQLTQTVHASLAALDDGIADALASVPAVSVKRSVGADRLTCLACGVALKTLKRHIRAVHGQTPEEYRNAWGLPHAYPMVAPAYAEARSRHAKSMGLGKRSATARR